MIAFCVLILDPHLYTSMCVAIPFLHIWQEVTAMDILHLEQQRRSMEVAGEAKRQAAAEAQRALRQQLEQSNAAALERSNREREKDRLSDAAALEYVKAKQREEVARLCSAEAARKERDRAYAAMLHNNKKVASFAVCTLVAKYIMLFSYVHHIILYFRLMRMSVKPNLLVKL